MKCGNLIAKILKREGIDFVTGFPRNALHEMLAEEGIRLIKFRTERVAINAADGFTRSSFCERHGVSVVQYGPGIENGFGGVAHAFADSVPILLLPAGYERQRKVAPNFDSLQNYREVTKWVDEVNFIEQAPDMFRRAFTYLKDGRPGPVMLVLPTDLITGEVKGPDLSDNYTPVKRTRSQGDPADIRETAKALIAAQCPVIRAGGGVLYAKAWDELKELAELLQIPVFTTLNGKSAFPESHSLALGAGGQSRPDMVMHFLKKADLVFAIGSSCTIEAFTTPLRPGCPVIQSTIDERDIGKDYPLVQAIIGDAKLVLRQLIEELKLQGVKGRSPDNDTVKEIKAVKDEWLKKWMPKLTSNEKPISPYRVLWDLQKVLDEKNSIITHDSGSLREQMLPFYVSNTPGGYLGWGKSTTMGQSLGLSLGAKIARPEKTVLHVIGDGSFGMVGMDFETGVRENIPIITVVLNNGKLGGYDTYFPTASRRFNLNKVSGDYTKIAEGLGAGYVEKVMEPGEIIPAVQRALKANNEGKSVLLEIFTEQDIEFSSFPTKW
jgi:acetolactate synthase-1/2/3 large subunit